MKPYLSFLLCWLILAGEFARADQIIIRGPIRAAAAGGGSVIEVGTATLNSQVTSSHSFSHTVPSGADVLVLRVGTYNRQSTGATWNGTAMTFAGGTQSGTDYCAIYYLTSPAATTANIVISYPSGGATVAYASNYDSVGSVSAYVGSTTTTLNISSQTGARVVDVLSFYNSTPTVGAGQTQEAYQNNGGANQSAAFSYEPGAATVTMSWTMSASRAQGSISINP